MEQIIKSFIDELEKIALVGAVPKMAPPPKTPTPKPAPSAKLAPTPAAKPPVLAPVTQTPKASVIRNPGLRGQVQFAGRLQAARKSLLGKKTTVPPLVKPDIQGVVTKPTRQINPISQYIKPLNRMEALGF